MRQGSLLPFAISSYRRSNHYRPIYAKALQTNEQLEAVLRSETRHRAIYSRKISVALNEGDKEYDVLLGSASILMAPLLYWAFMKLQRDEDAIIL